MEYIKENEIRLYEELCGFVNYNKDIPRIKNTIRFRENIKLVYMVAKNFSTPYDCAVDREDVIHEGYLGLMIACMNFDESKGYEFSTYAVAVIRTTILKFLRDSGAIKLPRRYKEIRSSLRSHGFTIPLTEEELDILVSEGKFSRHQLLEYHEPLGLSFDYEYTDDKEGSNLKEVIPDPDADIGYRLSEDEIDDMIQEILQYIKPNHRDMIEEWIYATLEGVKIGQERLAIKYNISQAQVSRAIKASIRLLKDSKSKILDSFGY